MIVLKILLYILLVVAAIVLFVLIVPAGGEYSYIDGKFRFKLKLWFINLIDSEGGGLYYWWKKRKANKKDKPEKPKKPKPVKSKKSKKKKKQREQYEWEKELEDIPVNDPEADAAENTAETVIEATGETSEKSEMIKKSEESENADTSSDKKKKNSDDEYGDIYDEDDDDDEKSSVSDKIEKIICLWESAQRPALKIMKGFRIYDLYIDFVIADEDAYKCALKYGRYSTAVFNGLAFFSEIFTIRFKTVDVRPQFGASKGRWDTSGKLAFRLGTTVIAGAWLLITYLFRTFLPEKIRKRKMKKSAARQK